MAGRDFKEFYTASKILAEGGNPYIPEVMYHAQSSLYGPSKPVLMLWSPPWVLPLMHPLRFLGAPQQALYLWNVWSICLVGIACLLLYSLVENTFNRQLVLIIAVISTAPLLDSFRLAQSTPLCIFSLALFVWALKREKPLLAGMSAAIWAIKPHLFFLVALAVLLGDLKNRWKILLGSAIGLTALVTISEVQYPGGTKFWLTTLSYSEDATYTIPRLAWLCSNLAGFIRSTIFFDPSVLVLIPFIAAAILTYVHIRRVFILSLPDDLSWLIPLGLLTAPYGWFYDQALCAVSTFLLLNSINDTALLKRAWIWILLWNLATVIFYYCIASTQLDLWWYPLGLLTIAAFVGRYSKSTSLHIEVNS